MPDRVWLVHPRPRPQESISSWLIRIAAAKGIRVHSLIEVLQPGLQFWTRDGDLIAPPALLLELAKRTGTPPKRALETALRTYEGVLDEDISGSRQSPMVTPLGVRHRIRRAFGQRFCSQCLADPDPYLRLTWRLTLFPCCVYHGTLLHDRCPSCARPYQPHRTGLCRCAHCGADLAVSPSIKADPRALALQAHNEWVLAGGAVLWPRLQGLHPLAFFSLQLALLRAVTSDKWGDRLRRGLQTRLGAIRVEFGDKLHTVRSLTPRSAHGALCGVELLLRGWPAMLVGICQEADSWATWIVPDDARARVPFVLREVLDTYLRPGSARRAG